MPTILDHRGRPATRARSTRNANGQPSAYGWGLFATPSSTNQTDAYRPRYYLNRDLEAELNARDRLQLLNYSRQLFAQLGNLGGAIVQKATYAVGEAWKPQFYGADAAWGQQVEEWLTEQFYPVADTRGQPFDFVTALFLDSLALDVDGDAAMLLTRAESGFPQLRFLTADRIGSRGDDEIKGGPYDGARLINGCIVNRDGRVIAYRVLGPTPEEDVDVSAFNCQLLFEPEWRAQFRGIPRIARTLLDWFDVQDIDAYLKRGVKLDASQGVVHYTETGTADTASDLLSDNEDTSIKDLRIERREGGEILYMKADSGEKVESFKSERPHPNTEAFIARLERRGLLAVGWFYELLDPSKLGGASVRLIQDEARHSIRARQKTIRKRAKRAITYAVAVAMKQKLIPRNEADWWKWDFELPAQLTVDAGYDRAADVEDLKLGLTTEAEVTAKRGKWWEDVRLQKKREVKALLTDAQDIAKEFNIPIQSALDLLSQRNPNPTPITETPDPRP